MSEYVNILVICVVSLPAYVNVAHLHLSVGEFSFRFCVRLGIFFLWMGWEGIIIEDIMDYVYFLVVFFIV